VIGCFKQSSGLGMVIYIHGVNTVFLAENPPNIRCIFTFLANLRDKHCVLVFQAWLFVQARLSA